MNETGVLTGSLLLKSVAGANGIGFGLLEIPLSDKKAKLIKYIMLNNTILYKLCNIPPQHLTAPERLAGQGSESLHQTEKSSSFFKKCLILLLFLGAHFCFFPFPSQYCLICIFFVCMCSRKMCMIVLDTCVHAKSLQ